MKKELFECEDYPSFLKTIFADRKNRNPRYSFRAFAKSLGLSHSYLLEILAAKKRLPIKRAKVLLTKLSLNPFEEQFFLELIEGTAEKRSRSRIQLSKESSAEDSVFSHWYSMVILELATLPHFKLTAARAAKAMDLPTVICEQAIEKLVALDMLEKDAKGLFHRKRTASVTTKTRKEVIEHYSEQVLELSKSAVKKQNTAERAIGSKVFPMSSRQFGILQEKLFNLLHEIMMDGIEATPSESYDSVYYVCAQLFKVAVIKKNSF